MSEETKSTPDSKTIFVDILTLALKTIVLSFGDSRIRCTFEYSPDKLHGVFLQAQKRFGQTLPELNELRFSKRGAFPYSRELSETMAILRLSRFIEIFGTRENSFDVVSQKDGVQEVLKETSEIFKNDEIRLRIFGDFVDFLKEKLLREALKETRIYPI
ncbi:MAG: hypothetical protein HYY55_03650 [Candidatus Niyogibacteria bacterium]|nr:MAG: hypothetical protein HYY55_03650 [Candidatus Niyogibacteria bacterium]